MPPTAAAALLPADVLQETETTLSVLASMFPEPELVLPPFALEQPLASLADLPDELRGVLTLTLDDADAAHEVLIDVVLGLRVGKHGQRLLVRQPAYLSNAQFRGVLDDVPPIQGGEAFIDDVLLLSDYLREAIPTVLREAEEAAAELEAERKRANANTEAEGDEIGMDRVWFWLPSLSTKEKRNDIVNQAPVWNLTGFVLAGKPGIICLEGTKRNVDAYMGWVKSVSWGDVPSFQKVTERHRESPITVRLFTGMCEITDLIGFGGHRGNRGEMGDVRRWIEERHVKSEVLGKVLNLGGA